MRRALAWCLFGLAGSIASLPGCGPDPFAKPPARRASVAEPEPTRTIFFVSADAPEADPEGWRGSAQREANLEGAIFRAVGPGEGRATDLAGLVRAAVADGASALVVVPAEAPGLAEALGEAESKGVPAVLIGRPVEAPAGSMPFTVAAPAPAAPMAGAIVEATLEDARKAGRPADGTAIVLADKAGDAFAADRADALRVAAEKAGLKPVVVEFQSPTTPAIAAEATRAILRGPETSVVLADGDASMLMATRIHADLAGRVKFALGGFARLGATPLPPVYSEESGFATYRTEELGRLAVRAALDRLGGEARGRRVEGESRFRRGTGKNTENPRIPGEPPKTLPPGRTS